MSKDTNLTLIGAFVVGAVVLATGALIIFGGGKFFKDTVSYVAFFDGSVKGLRPGAAVNFRGAKVGSVTDIRLVFRQEDGKIFIPVVIEFNQGTVAPLDGTTAVARGEESHHAIIKDLTENRGLRAELAMDSFVTGQLSVQLDFHKDAPLNFVGIAWEYPELPTTQSGFERLTNTIEKIPLKKIFDNLNTLIESMDELAESGEIKDAVTNLSVLAREGAEFVDDLNSAFPALQEKTEILTQNGIEFLEQGKITLKRYEDFVKPGSELEYELRETLVELRGAARSLRVFADYLERHPEALLRGKDAK